MRTRFSLRSRPAQVAVGAVMLALPASAVALTAQPIAAPGVPTSTPVAVSFSLARNPIQYGEKVSLRGNAPAGDSGRRLALEFAPPGGSWRTIALTALPVAGGFQLTVRLRESGQLRIVDAPSVGAAIPAGAPHKVAVAARFEVARGVINALGGQPVRVRGRLLPAARGRLVGLQARALGRWQTIAFARTGRDGRFDVRYRAGNPSQQRLRVRFRGDRLNEGTASPAGRLTVYGQSVASWYDDTGATACGFHAYYGVAHRDLPCGSQVTFRYGGHSVTAVVDDRGPFVDGRDWDLNQNTAAGLGFGGVDTVWSSP